MQTKLLPIALLSLVLCSCASLEQQNKEFADYVNTLQPPLKPSPPASPSSETAATGKREVCRKGEVIGKNDVDTAYVRAMKLIGFETPEQKERQGLWLATNYRHTVTLGVLYDLWDSVDIAYTDGTLRGATVGVRITKEGAGSEVSYRYCALEQEGAAFFAFMDTQFQNIAGASSPTKSGVAKKSKK
jgi:hypothetical protein